MSARALLDLFRRHREKATGLWKLGQEPGRTVYFESGDIVFAHSTHPMDRLTHLLVERGKITQAQLDYALANLRPGISIGKNLIEMGFITQRDLLEVARAQVERVVCASLATQDLEPSFEAKELDATVVRLPFDTPELLLNGLLGLKDREGLLELLGPLNQVVVLQGRRLLEMNLPSDLAKLPPLLDGTHTLLELSRESLAEPMRLGILALFLREMGWARLHEMPPMDRSVLDLALTPEPEMPSAPLPEIETVPSLFSSIQAAAKPTTNLEHLSQALDALPETYPLPEPEPEPEPESELDAFGFSAESGRAILPTPAEFPEIKAPLPAFDPGEAPAPREASITILPSTLTGSEPTPTEPLPEFEEELPRKGSFPWLALLAILALGAAGTFAWFRMRHRPRVQPAPVQVTVPPKAMEPSKPEIAPPPVPPAPTLEAKPPEKAEPVPEPEPKAKSLPSKEPGTSAGERAEALRKGDTALAVRQGAKFAKGLPKGHWTLRLEIACQPETLRRAVELFGDSRPDLWVLPLRLRDGRGCFQVFQGHYPSRALAEKAVRKLPAAFRGPANRPKPFQIGEIALKQ